MHEQYGGVFPNLAKREHAKNLVPLLQQTLEETKLHQGPTFVIQRSDLGEIEKILSRETELWAQLEPFLQTHAKPDIDAIAVTAGPGLEPALWVGINFAKALAHAWNLPIVAVNHMEGHIILSMMEKNRLAKFEFPALALLISGGHTELVLSKKFGQYELIGQTRDDAAGEAFDKVARMLGLPYPGGPEISRLAAQARERNIKPDLSLPRPMMNEDNFDFSFSGLKTAVQRLIGGKELTDDQKMKIAREFEDAVAEVLITKTLRAIETYGTNTVVVGGGVSANEHIRAELGRQLAAVNCKLLSPPPELATDNAIMIGLAGYFHARKYDFADPATLAANGNLRLA